MSMDGTVMETTNSKAKMITNDDFGLSGLHTQRAWHVQSQCVHALPAHETCLTLQECLSAGFTLFAHQCLFCSVLGFIALPQSAFETGPL